MRMESEKGYTCPMHPEVRQAVAGSCPKCGMALELVEPIVASSKTEWTCPMHPEIVCASSSTTRITGSISPNTPPSGDHSSH